MSDDKPRVPFLTNEDELRALEDSLRRDGLLPAGDDGEPLPEPAPPKKRSGVGGFIGAAIKIAGKGAPLLKAIKLLKFAKPLVTLVSLSISFMAYGLVYGPGFAAGFLALLFLHEMGHVVALRIKGYAVGGPVFIPFLGAAIFAPMQDMDRDTEAFVGYGGPLLGTITSLMVLPLALAFDGNVQHTLVAISMTGVFLNVFNLIPMSPLDGGRVLQAVGAWTRWLGIAILLAFTLAARQPQMLIIWILVLDGFEGMRRWMRPTLSGILLVAMCTLFLLGYGNQHWAIYLVDGALGSLFTYIYYLRDKKRQNAPKDERPYPAPAVRMKWAALYALLLVVSGGALAWQLSHFQAHDPARDVPATMQ